MKFEAGQTVKWRVAGRDAVGVVDKVVSSGAVPGITATVVGPAARVQVARDNVLTDDYVGIPLKLLSLSGDRVEATAALRKEYKIRQPDDEDLRIINSMLPTGAPPRTIDNTVVVPLIAADNLVNRGLDKWDLPSLERMADLMVGVPAMLDHDWHDVSKTWGKVFRAQYQHTDKAPVKALNMAGNGALNRRVVKEEGYGIVVAEVFTRPTHPVVQAVQDGYIGKVSTGGFEFKDFHCPECKTSFRDESCPHYIPNKYWGETQDRDPQVAPYAVRVGLSDMGEVSIVTIPNLPNAGVI